MNRILLAAVLAVSMFAGCADDGGSASPTSSNTVVPQDTNSTGNPTDTSKNHPGNTAFGPLAIGVWTADTTLIVQGQNLTLGIADTVRADSTFLATVTLDSVFGNPVIGPVYTRAGSWMAPGDSLLIFTPLTCHQADTASLPFFGPVPFHTDASNNLIANALVTVPCGAPHRFHPTSERPLDGSDEGQHGCHRLRRLEPRFREAALTPSMSASPRSATPG
ncbi:MAG: hypothetical protein H6686_12320 [Fibrobacteria bacterium]|nr:hypothetical protein [Fibrobacteria bacterium]